MRRKACDLCFTKKIKCDYAEPECSNCLLYRTRCHTSIVRSKAKAHKPRRTAAERRPIETQEYVGVVASRLDKVEGKIDELLKNQSGSDERPPPTASWRFNPLSPSLYYGPADKRLYLPPLDDILPIIELYFDTANTVLPLFNRDRFMRSVTAWYAETSTHTSRNRATWGSILMVIALGLQERYPDEGANPSLPGTGHLSDYCIRNAQGILPELMARGEDLTGIQVVTALVILYLRTGDACPAVILMGMAAALCRRLQLHSGSGPGDFTAQELQLRSRVFWVLYVVDQDVALRAKTPAALPGERHTDVPLPESTPDQVLRTLDGNAAMDMFRMRIALAEIEGSVYELLYASGSRTITPSERQRRVAVLHASLTAWYALVPPELRMDAVSDNLSDDALRHATNMYHVYLLCLVATHGLYSTQADWMRRVGALARASVQDFAAAMQGPRVTLCTQYQAPPLAPGWAHCVEVARGTIRLFEVTRPTEALIWQCSCAHFSALIILLANIVTAPGDPCSAFDYQAASRATELFSQLCAVMETPAYGAIHRVIRDLHGLATLAVESCPSEWASASFVLGEDVDLGSDVLDFLVGDQSAFVS